MQRREIEDRVLDLMRAALKVPVELHTRRSEVAAWDSLRHIELVFAVEDELDVRFAEEDLSRLDSAAAIVDAVVAQACSTST